MIERVCRHCGKTFLAKLAHANRGEAVFCSQDCYHASTVTRSERQCELCGKTFVTWPAQINLGHGRFCGKSCAAKAQARPLTEYLESVMDRCPDSEHYGELQGRVGAWGYGAIKVEGRSRLAHDVAWEVAHGCPIPPNFDVHHMCQNKRCLIPSHLELIAHDKHGEGERNPSAKLTEKNVLDIRGVYAHGGVTYETLAAQYSVSKLTIGLIVRRQAWDHVQEVNCG